MTSMADGAWGNVEVRPAPPALTRPARVYTLTRRTRGGTAATDEPFVGAAGDQVEALDVDRVAWKVPVCESWSVVKVEVWCKARSRRSRTVTLRIANPADEMASTECALNGTSRIYVWCYVYLRDKHRRSVVAPRDIPTRPLVLLPSSMFVVQSDKLPISVRATLNREPW